MEVQKAPGSGSVNPDISTPEQELTHLRQEVARRERELLARGADVTDTTRNQIISDKVRDHAAAPVGAILAPHARLEHSTIKELALNLSPEPHDVRMSELLEILNKKGVKNALSVVEALNDPHVEDDFHRFLVQYIKKGYDVPGLKRKSALFESLAMTLYEVSLPESESGQSGERPLKELLSAMDQFYAGMIAGTGSGRGGSPGLFGGLGGLTSGDTSAAFGIEIANPNHSQECIIYVAVPDDKRDLFEKQITSLFPKVRIVEVPDDYNVFNEMGDSIGAIAHLGKYPLFPLKTYEHFDHDPLNVILNTFSKIQKDNEGAALQLLFRPAGESGAKEYRRIIEGVQNGKSIKDLLPKSFGGELLSDIGDAFFGPSAEEKKKKEEKEKEQPKPVDQTLLATLNEKVSSPLIEVNIRLIVSAAIESDAERIISDLESAFSQFENAQGNKISWKKVTGKKLKGLAEEFSFREFSPSDGMPLNFKEVTTLFHFPERIAGAAPQVRQAKAGSAAAPLDLPQEGTLLGVNRFRSVETKAFITKEDRLRHFYTIGQTGTGKSTLLKNMIIQDIQQGEGVCMIDPHGVDIVDVLANIPPKRYEDVIYFDPGYAARPMGLNMLEYDVNFPEQKTFVVNELFSIFKKLYGDTPEAMGPAFEQYFRNSALLVMEHPESGNTLLDVSRVLSDKEYRKFKLSVCKNPLVSQFWANAEKTTGDQGLANYVQYVTNKFDVFLANEIMRPVVSQERSSFNFRDVMDNRKILLVNLAKGKLGDINANLIGLILVGKILMAALSRVDSLGKNLPAFYLYIDEFQNITTNSIATILSEARKYKLSLTIAHQFIAQLEENIRDAVFGNVGSLGVFRVGTDDAEYLQKQFNPTFTAKDLVNVENRHAYVKLLVNGRPAVPFNIETLPPPPGDRTKLDALKQLSYLKYGRDRATVEAEIMAKYQKIEPKPLASPVNPATQI